MLDGAQTMVSRYVSVIVGVSFIPLLIKAVGYALIDSFLPLMVTAIAGVLITWGMYHHQESRRIIFRIWSIAIGLWGIARIVLMFLFSVTSVSERHIEDQFTPWFVIVSVVYLLLSIAIFRATRSVS